MNRYKLKAMFLVGTMMLLLIISGCGNDSVKEVGKAEANAEETAATNLDDEVKKEEFEGIVYEVPDNKDFTLVEEDQYETVPYVKYLFNGGSATFNIIAEDLSAFPMKYTLEEYVEASTKNAGYDYGKKEYKEGNGFTYSIAEAPITVSTGAVYTMRQYTFLNNEVAYILTFACDSEYYEENPSLMDNIINSVSFK